MLHGDLSPNNIIVNLERKAGDPALYLIDFDGFVAPAAGGALEQLSYAEGGTIGTPGYHPPDLEEHVSAGVGETAPYSDRYGRDILILEFLCFHKDLKDEGSPTEWGWQGNPAVTRSVSSGSASSAATSSAIAVSGNL